MMDDGKDPWSDQANPWAFAGINQESQNYQSGDPPSGRGPIVGVPLNDLNDMKDRIRELEAEVAVLKLEAKVARLKQKGQNDG